MFFVLLLAAPLAGVMMKGESPARYLQFPPLTTMVEQSSFSWVIFVAVFGFVIITTFPFWRRLDLRILKIGSGHASRHKHGFPWWGWVAATGTLLFWILAWTRFEWFEPLQRYTFFPVWFCFIVFLNAVAFRMSGKSLLTDRTLSFVLLFPVSAAFWWVFEYLNRFVNNWHYIGTAEIGGWQYFGEASLAFSTVLPAVLSVRFILLQTKLFTEAYRDFPELPWITSSSLWNATGVVSLLGLIAVGLIPELAYPLIWILPGLLWIVWQRWNGFINPLLKEASEGDFTLVWSSACAALLCGFFWEMWNIYSQAKWVYNIPGVDRFHLFEMPLLGYAGYLPFGVICALIGDSLLDTISRRKHRAETNEHRDEKSRGFRH